MAAGFAVSQAESCGSTHGVCSWLWTVGLEGGEGLETQEREGKAVWVETAGQHPGQGRGCSWERPLTGEVGPEHGDPLGVGVLVTAALGQS